MADVWELFILLGCFVLLGISRDRESVKIPTGQVRGISSHFAAEGLVLFEVVLRFILFFAFVFGGSINYIRCQLVGMSC